MPGNIRKAEFFVAFMRRFNEYLKARTHLSGCGFLYLTTPTSRFLLSADQTACAARCLGDPDLLPAAHPADSLHGQEATAVS